MPETKQRVSRHNGRAGKHGVYNPKHNDRQFDVDPRLTEGRFCEEHQRKENQRYEKYDRDPAVRRRYGRVWKRIRDSYVKDHPFCEKCFENGVLVEVEEVHHIKPLAEGGTHEKSNLISLCKSCHARIHAERGDRWHKHGG